MITLFRTADCPRCRRIQDALEDLAVAHRVVVVVEGRAGLPAEVASAERLPVLLDDGERFVGAEAILKHLEGLEAFSALWYKFQSDACYCDEEDGVA